MIAGLPYFSQWIEAQAKKWVNKNADRIPVKNKPTVGWKNRGTLIANGNLSTSVAMTIDLSDQIQTHTVQFDGFNNDLNIGALPSITAVAQAEVLWSVGGVEIRRLVSVIDGLSISGAAQAVTVNIRDVTLNNINLPAATYSVGMTVVPGLRANTGQPPILRVNGTNEAGTEFQFFGGAAPGERCDWIVPSNAGVNSFFVIARLTGAAGADMADTDLSIELDSINTGDMMRFDASSRNLWLPIFGGVRRIRVVNNHATRSMNLCVILGIDG